MTSSEVYFQNITICDAAMSGKGRRRKRLLQCKCININYIDAMYI